MLSLLAHEIKDSPTLALAHKTRKLKNEGHDIVDLGTGHLDYEPPRILKDSIKKLLDTPDVAKYIPVSGLPVLREHIAHIAQEFYKKSMSINNILIGSGAKTVLYIALLTIINPGDEVLVIAPYRPSYIEQIKLVGCIPVVVQSAQDCHLDIQAIQEHITPKTKCIITNSPNNPSGVVYTYDEWNSLITYIGGKDIFLISDEMYKDFSFDEDYVSPLMVADETMREKILVIDGLSKNIAIPGWRVGWIIADASIINAMSTIQSNMTGNAPSLIQYGLAGFFAENDRSFVSMVREKLATIKNMIQTLLYTADIEYVTPSGSLYFFIKIPSEDSVEFCQRLLEQGGVATIPGIYFGREGYIRICYAMDTSIVQEGIRRLIVFMK